MTDADTNKQVVVDPDSERVLMIFNFPVYPERNEIHLRSAEEVGKRALSLHLLLGVIFYKEPEKVAKWALNEGLWDSLSPQEQDIFRVPISKLDPAEKKWKQQALQSNLLTWRIEGLLTLLWSMGLVEKLELPIERCDGFYIGRVLPVLDKSVQPFLRQARLRSIKEIAQMLEKHIQIYNDQVEAYKNEEELQFDMMITYERIHALNWVCGLIDEWDD